LVFLSWQHKKVETAIKEWNQSKEEFGVSLSSDGWTSNNWRNFMNIVVMTNNGAYFQDAIDTAECETPRGKDAAFVVSIIIKAIEDIGPKHVVSIVTDGASVMKAAWDRVTQKFPHIVCQWCASHVLDLLMEDIGKMPTFSEDISLVKDVIKFINNHEWTFNLFKKKR
jgi:hypothetical protein